MSPPPIPQCLSRTGSKSWAAWECMWDALDDGEWHRSIDLTYMPGAAGIDVPQTSASELLRRATVAGLIEREARPTVASRGGMPGPVISRETFWYRRKPEDGAL